MYIIKLECPQVQTYRHRTKPIFKLGGDYDESNQYTKFGDK